ncbi:hypothetical protein AB0N62_41075 [Streptomyces sp. NPDC093982]|uniref:hypothetical protein n=1 Tax=Streptomyces sp. NPDC093982 TaxID=3155077 RepID=UPI0034386435
MRRAKMRWRIEHDYRDLKHGLGLDHFEGRACSTYGRPLAGIASADVVAGLVAFLWDGVRDFSPAQVLADLAAGVGAGGEHVIGANPRTPGAGLGHVDTAHDLDELGVRHRVVRR